MSLNQKQYSEMSYVLRIIPKQIDDVGKILIDSYKVGKDIENELSKLSYWKEDLLSIQASSTAYTTKLHS
jgi:hypothetical protein